MIPTRPNLPKGDVKTLIVSDGLDRASAKTLKERGIEIIFLHGLDMPDRRISRHADIGACLPEAGSLCVCPSYAGTVDIKGINIVKGAGDPGSAYPDDCAYNVCIVGEYAIHDFRHTDRVLYSFLYDRYELIDIKQGYAKCMISVISKKCVATQDRGIAVKLERYGFDVLHIDEKNIRLEGYPYGFIGGASFLLNENTWCLNGSLEKLDSCYNIENAMSKKGIGIICLNDDFPVDVGSFIQIFEGERCHEKKS
jgi:hypothetical protein